MVYITGDMHGEDARWYDRQLKKLKAGDTLLICGDFGYVWNGSKREKKDLEYLGSRPYAIGFLDGTHENFDLLNSYRQTVWNGGRVHRISGSLFHLIRGQIFTIEGQRYFVFGGGESPDKEIRLEQRSWWREELPSPAEMAEGAENLDEAGLTVDYILTHEPPSLVKSAVLLRSGQADRVSKLNGYLEEIDRSCTFRHWYFGSIHEDRTITPRHTALFRKIIPVGEDLSNEVDNSFFRAMLGTRRPSVKRGAAFPADDTMKAQENSAASPAGDTMKAQGNPAASPAGDTMKAQGNPAASPTDDTAKILGRPDAASPAKDEHMPIDKEQQETSPKHVAPSENRDVDETSSVLAVHPEKSDQADPGREANKRGKSAGQENCEAESLSAGRAESCTSAVSMASSENRASVHPEAKAAAPVPTARAGKQSGAEGLHTAGQAGQTDGPDNEEAGSPLSTPADFSESLHETTRTAASDAQTAACESDRQGSIGSATDASVEQTKGQDGDAPSAPTDSRPKPPSAEPSPAQWGQKDISNPSASPLKAGRHTKDDAKEEQA